LIKDPVAFFASLQKKSKPDVEDIMVLECTMWLAKVDKQAIKECPYDHPAAIYNWYTERELGPKISIAIDDLAWYVMYWDKIKKLPGSVGEFDKLMRKLRRT
jgi:hypothetical protein